MLVTAALPRIALLRLGSWRKKREESKNQHKDLLYVLFNVKILNEMETETILKHQNLKSDKQLMHREP